MTDTLTVLTEHPFLAGLPADSLRRLLPYAKRAVHHTGERLFHQGGHADRFWLIRQGRVSLEFHVEGRGEVVIEQLGPGSVVGWSWMFPPYRWHFGAVAAELVHSVEIDAQSVPLISEEDPAFGYEVTKRFAALLAERLQASQLRLVDLYGCPPTGTGPMALA